jgi:GntR family transcriptional regulator, rspAB operon transcriptional repressor
VQFVNQPASPEPLIQKQALARQLYDLLESRIISGELPLGSSLVEEDMAREFGISRSPVREALSRLERTMLVERVGPRNRRIVVPTSKFISDIYDTWVIIETGRAYSSCINASASDYRRIEKLLDGMELTLQNRELSRHLELSTKFHELLTRHCRNKYLLQLHRDCQRYVQWFVNIYYKRVDISERSMREHREIARHYIDKDFLGLADSLQRHIRRQKNQVLANIVRAASDGIDVSPDRIG